MCQYRGPELTGGLDAGGLRLERDGEGRTETIAWRAAAAPHARFHSKPGAPVTATYGVTGDLVRVLAETQGWVHAVYADWKGNETTGWLLEGDLCPLP